MLEEVAQNPRAVGAQGGPLILEVGCGSGAISLSLLSQLPQVSVPSTPPHPRRLAGTHRPCPVSARSTGGAAASLRAAQPAAVTASTSHAFCLAGPWSGEGRGVVFPPFLAGVGAAVVPGPGLSQHLPPMCPSLFLGAEPSHRCG